MPDQKPCPRRCTLTTTEAAALYGVSPRTAQRWATRYGAPHGRISTHRHIVFDRAALESWLARGGWLKHKKEQKR